MMTSRPLELGSKRWSIRALSLGIKIPHTISDTTPQIQNGSVSQYYTHNIHLLNLSPTEPFIFFYAEATN